MRELFEASGLYDSVSKDNFYPSVPDAVHVAKSTNEEAIVQQNDDDDEKKSVSYCIRQVLVTGRG